MRDAKLARLDALTAISGAAGFHVAPASTRVARYPFCRGAHRA